MMLTNTFSTIDVLDMLFLILSCALMLVNFLFGGFITFFLLLRRIVQRKRREGYQPSYRAYFGLLALSLICFGIGIGIFDLQLSSALKSGTMIVKGLWSLVFSVVFFEASAFMFVSEMQKFRGNCNG